MKKTTTGKNLKKVHGLIYVADTSPGITRKKSGKHFAFFNTKGGRIKDAAEIARIRKLAIPPAYKNVWICPLPNGHLQATGIDARGRKQYRYHADWRKSRDENKFEHILNFGDALPAIRRRVTADLKKKGLPADKVMASIVRLLEKTLIRVGNEEYAKTNNSFGLTTLQARHVKVHGTGIDFAFKGKSNKQWHISLHDKIIAKIVTDCAHIPGHELFKYLDDAGKSHDVTSTHINKYIHDISGKDFTAKDFRTWSGTVIAALTLREMGLSETAAQAKKNLVQAIEHVAEQLGNTPSVCRKCYIHPEVINAYLAGDLARQIGQQIDAAFRARFSKLTDDEIVVLAFLRRRLHKLSAKSRKKSP